MLKSKNKKFSICRLIATSGILLIIVFSVCSVGTMSYFVTLFHIPSILFIFGASFFLLLGTYGTDFLKFIPDSLLILLFKPLEPNPRYKDIAKFGSRYVVGCSVIQALFDAITMLRNLSSPASLGAGMALALLPLLYALVASELFFAFVYKSYSDEQKTVENKPLALKNAILPVVIAGLINLLLFIRLTCP